jgi:hypothetical protein
VWATKAKHDFVFGVQNPIQILTKVGFCPTFAAVQKVDQFRILITFFNMPNVIFISTNVTMILAFCLTQNGVMLHVTCTCDAWQLIRLQESVHPLLKDSYLPCGASALLQQVEYLTMCPVTLERRLQVHLWNSRAALQRRRQRDIHPFNFSNRHWPWPLGLQIIIPNVRKDHLHSDQTVTATTF